MNSSPVFLVLTLPVSDEWTGQVAGTRRRRYGTCCPPTAEAQFDAESGIGHVRHYGQRLGMTQFRPFFDAMKAGASAAKLTEILMG
jgi:hypothetical protein